MTVLLCVAYAHNRSQRAFANFVRAAGTARSIEGRLTAGVAYRRPKHSAGAGADAAGFELLSAASELQRAADSHPTPANLHAWGVAQLVLGRIEPAVETLLASVLERPDPRALADLAAGQLALATAADRPEELPQAAESIEQALGMDPQLGPAWFTKALVLERLRLPVQARVAWEKYLDLDRGSGWAREARQHLARLHAAADAKRWSELESRLLNDAINDDVLEEAVTNHSSDLRDLLTRRFLASWADAANPDIAAQRLLHISRLAERLERHIPDKFFARFLTEIKQSSPGARQVLASAVLEYSAGLEAQATEQPASAIIPHLQAALVQLKARQSVLALSVQLSLIRALAVLQKQDEAIVLAGEVASEARRLALPSIEARARLALGMAAFTLSRWSDAITNYDLAIALFQATNEPAMEGYVHQNAAVLNRFLGNRRATWAHRARAGRQLTANGTLQIHTYLTSGAATASVEGLPLTALSFQDEVVANAESLPIGPQTEAHISRARMLARLGRHANGVRDLAAAEELIKSIRSDGMKSRFQRAWLLASAEVHLPSDPNRAAADATQAVRLITAANERVRLAEASLIRSRALTSLGRLREARSAGLEGIAEVEAALGSIDPRDPVRIAALEPVWALYAEGARLELAISGDNYAGAFEISERGRSRSHLDLLKIAPLSLPDVQQRLRPDQAILILDQSPQDLLSWWITHGQVRVERTTLAETELDRIVTAHRRSIQRGQRRHASSARLFDLAIRPYWNELGKKSIVAVISDGAWNRIAWPALWESSSEQELVTRVAIVQAASATMALKERDTTTRTAREALVVSAPLTDAGPALAEVRAEASEIAGIYPQRTVLDGADALPARVLELAAGVNIVHISSHAVDVPEYPLLSHLMLGNRARQAPLFVRDIAAADLSHVELVVLAACSTAGQTSVKGEGTVGVAWGFLTAGARQVIATLQEIDDRSSRRLFPRIHRMVAEGWAPAKALQLVQRELAAAGEPLQSWAIVASFGAL